MTVTRNLTLTSPTHPRASARRFRRTAIPETPWMITFGDLITLILCFFLALVSTGAYRLGERQHHDADHGPLLASLSSQKLASSKKRQSFPPLLVTEEDLMQSEELGRRIIRIVTPSDKGATLLIESCRTDGDEQIERDLRIITSATDQLHLPRRLGFRNGGCTANNGATPIAQISVSLEESA